MRSQDLPSVITKNVITKTYAESKCLLACVSGLTYTQLAGIQLHNTTGRDTTTQLAGIQLTVCMRYLLQKVLKFVVLAERFDCLLNFLRALFFHD